MRAEVQQLRMMDELQCAQIAQGWMDAIVKEWGVGQMTPDRQAEITNSNGTMALWLDRAPVALAVITRDVMNYSVLTTIKIGDGKKPPRT